MPNDWYGASEPEGGGPQASTIERQAAERDETYARHSQARDAQHKSHEKEIKAMNKRHEDEMAAEDRWGAGAGTREQFFSADKGIVQPTPQTLTTRACPISR